MLALVMIKNYNEHFLKRNKKSYYLDNINNTKILDSILKKIIFLTKLTYCVVF